MTTALTSQEKPARWVHSSSDASIANGQISLLALLEIPLAMTLFGTLAYYSPWPWFSLLGCMAAPILLLRSERSIRTGQVLLWRYMRKQQLSKRATVLLISMTSLITVGTSYALVSTWLVQHVGWSLIWRIAMLGCLTVAIAVALAFVIECAFACACAFVTAVQAAGAGAYEFALMVVFAALVWMAFVITDEDEIPERFADVITLLITPGIVIGLLLRGTCIRIYATLRHAPEGLQFFARNWRETVTVIDAQHPPTLLPHAEKISKLFSVRHLLHGQNNGLLSWFITRMTIVFIYLPALLYRWNIKASTWLWGPIAYALRPAAWADNEAIRESMAPQTTWPLLGFVLTALLVWLAWLLAPVLPTWVVSEAPAWARTLWAHLPTPALNLRTGLSTLCLISWFCFLWYAYCLRAKHDKPLGDADNFKKYDDNLKARFRDVAKRVRVSAQWTAALTFLTVWTFALSWALTQWPVPMQHVVWDWLKPWL